MCILSYIYGSHSLELGEDIELFYVVQDFCLVTVCLQKWIKNGSKTKPMSTPNEVKYKVSMRLMCPKCDTNVHVRTAGPAGLKQHQGMGPCQFAHQKREQQKKTCTLFDFPLKQGKKDAATSNLVMGSSSLKRQLAFPAPIIIHPLVGPALSVPDHTNLICRPESARGVH